MKSLTDEDITATIQNLDKLDKAVRGVTAQLFDHGIKVPALHGVSGALNRAQNQLRGHLSAYRQPAPPDYFGIEAHD